MAKGSGLTRNGHLRGANSDRGTARPRIQGSPVMTDTKADPCAFVRQQVEHKEEEIADLEATLGDPHDDLPPAIKAQLQAMLARAKARLIVLREQLARCEAQA